jgi:hypothetical protein
MVDNTTLAFEALDEPPGIEVVDRVERLRYRLRTDTSVSPTPAATDSFLFPVGNAVSVTAETLTLPTVVSVCVRDTSGEMLEEVGHLEEATFDDGAYILELSTQIKTYVELEGPVRIVADLFETHIEFEEPTDLKIGALSWHDRPAATITTTEDPVDMMAAVSAFGSALKATDPERSYPSNRGHPPAVELGDTLDIPDEIDPPETGVRIEIPATHEAVYTVAPLAYYLGARVVPGPVSRLVTETGFEHRLDTPNGLETGVERTLKQVFLLDCVTRTEGVYDVPLHERSAIEDHVDLDWAALYEKPLAEQVATYLDVPYTLVEEHVPEWRLAVHVDPVADTVEQLPFVVDDLAIVRTVESPRTGDAPTATGPTEALTRDSVLTRSAAESQSAGDSSYVEPDSTAALEQAWIGDRIPIGASKLTPDAFQNRLDREATDDDISISIVLNDTRMAEERDLVDRAYGDRENLPFDVTIHRDLTVAQLREQLQQESDFFHYIGHTERDGFECADGKLDVATLEETGVDSFLLNACNSYQQGVNLIEAGAIGGIVTLSDVINTGAIRMGESIARLLNAGFPLRAALTVAREENVLGGQYIVVGDGGMTVTQAASRTPTLLEIEANRNDFVVDIKTYATDDAGVGSMYKPFIKSNEKYYLSSGKIATFEIGEGELNEFLQFEDVPVKTDESLKWSSSLDIEEISQ